jgi:CRISPR/Cas system-associated protein Cas10 (large subunit of type III CRISPR-Cas system)
MSRNKSNTETVREQYEYHRHDMKKQLASQVLSIVGVRYFRTQPYLTTKDIQKQEEALGQLLGLVRASYTAKERQRLYNKCIRLGMSITKLVLTSVGHPLQRSGCRLDADTTCCKFSLDPAALCSVMSDNRIILSDLCRIKTVAYQ